MAEGRQTAHFSIIGELMDTYIGFDSAWTDKKNAPGAICALSFEGSRPAEFHEPRLATFAEALEFIAQVRSSDGATLVALDQPTIVPNLTSMRPVERVAASVVSWLGGGVQPSNRGKVGMFCDASPIWRFLADLGATEDPENGRVATDGLHIIEVFPALALPSLENAFFGRLLAPRYNPARKKTFRLAHWQKVAEAAASQFKAFGSLEAQQWCAFEAQRELPKKADQDRLDAMLCLLIGLHWRLSPRSSTMLLGDLREGYMVAPCSGAMRARLAPAAERFGISLC